MAGGVGGGGGGGVEVQEKQIVALLTTSKNMSTDKPRKEGKARGRRGGGVSKKHNQLLGGVGRRGGGVLINHNQFDWHRRLEHVVRTSLG